MANPTLTKAMLNDLMKGCSAISLLKYPEAGVTFNGESGLDFSSADKIFTLKDSFQLSSAEPTVDEVKIDQGDQVIDTNTEKGDWTMTGNIPSVAKELIEYFYNKGVESVSVTGSDGTKYSGSSFFADPKEVICSVLVESQTKKTAIVFAKVKFVVGLSNDDSSTPAYLKFTGNVLSNTAEGQGDFSVLKAIDAA